LERVGSRFTAYQSSDRTSWTPFAGTTVSMRATVFAGLAVTSRDPAVRTTAEFSGIALTSSLPAGWESSDIPGSVNGATFYAGGTFLMRAGGTEIWGNSDEFRYTYQAM